MSDARFRRFARISSLESARALFLIVVGLAIREALLFLVGQNVHTLWVRGIVTISFVFTVFRFAHGVAIIYELEKKTAETTATPSAKKVDLIFGLFMLIGIWLFLMSQQLTHPGHLIVFTLLLLGTDLVYIRISKTLRDATFFRFAFPAYWIRRWRETVAGTPARTHVQWALSDMALAGLLSLTAIERPIWTPLLSGSANEDWLLAISALLVAAGIADYRMNYEFYFGRALPTGRPFVFVSSPLDEGGGDSIANNIRRSQWYCRRVSEEGRVPIARHGLYPYLLAPSSDLARRSAHEFLQHCDAIYLYTADGTKDDAKLTDGMRDQLKRARAQGMEIRYLAAEDPPSDFAPPWAPLDYPSSEEPAIKVSPQNWKKIFVCSALFPTPAEEHSEHSDKLALVREHVRLAQWLCYNLLKNQTEKVDLLAVFAPHAFFPYFSDYEPGATKPGWTDYALELLRICDAIYVYTVNGFESDAEMSPGMMDCVERARSLGLEIEFHKIDGPSEGWKPAPWSPPFASTRPVAPTTGGQ